MKPLSYVIEIPYYDRVSGGIKRMSDLANKLWTIEVPHQDVSAAGVRDNVEMFKKMSERKINVHLRVQRIVKGDKIKLNIPYSVGLPDKSFPACDRVITYSDTPYGQELTDLPQVGKVGIYMLSYGMALERERKNVLNQKITVMTTTNRSKELIEKEGVTCHKVGFGTDSYNFFVEPHVMRKRWAALLYHPAPDKNYSFGAGIVNKLCHEGLIDGVVTFGKTTDYNKFVHPAKLVRHYQNATRAEVRELFSSSSLFIMPSITEGLNLTPMEANLCGCPPVLCDGAVGDLYFDEMNCLLAKKNDFNDTYDKCKRILNEDRSVAFKDFTSNQIKNFTWAKTITNILEVMK